MAALAASALIAVLLHTAAAEAETMRIRITLNGNTVTATLDDNATARDLLSLLPITVTLEDYGETEKIAYLPRRLSTAGAPSAIEPRARDVTYYAPWGNLAIFRRDFRLSSGLVKLGTIDSGFEALLGAGSTKATIEHID